MLAFQKREAGKVQRIGSVGDGSYNFSLNMAKPGGDGPRLSTIRTPRSNGRQWPRPDAEACNGRKSPLSMRSRPIMKRSHIREPLSVSPSGFRKSVDQLSENPNPYRPKASRAIFEEI